MVVQRRSGPPKRFPVLPGGAIVLFDRKKFRSQINMILLFCSAFVQAALSRR
jgi:hypothetical protein